MNVVPSVGFDREFKGLPRDVQRRVMATIERFAADPHHPSLRFKKLESREPIWSIRVTRDVRITMTVAGDVATLRRVGHHDAVYRRP